MEKDVYNLFSHTPFNVFRKLPKKYTVFILNNFGKLANIYEQNREKINYPEI